MFTEELNLIKETEENAEALRKSTKSDAKRLVEEAQSKAHGFSQTQNCRRSRTLMRWCVPAWKLPTVSMKLPLQLPEGSARKWQTGRALKKKTLLVLL